MNETTLEVYTDIVTLDTPQISLDLNNEPRIRSRWLADGLGIRHKALMETIRKYELEIRSFGVLPFETAKPSKGTDGGRPETFTSLNEDQAYFVLTLSRNTQKVVALKIRLVKEFGRLRRAAEQRSALDWQQARIEGKDARRHETDTIANFVEYATIQGSQNAKRYYVNITKMTYKALFMVEQGLKIPNKLRDMLDGMQLTFLATAEYVCAKGLREGMDLKLPYKAIYMLARERVETYATTVGQTPTLPH